MQDSNPICPRANWVTVVYIVRTFLSEAYANMTKYLGVPFGE